MTISPGAEAILRSILACGAESDLAPSRRQRAPSPDVEQLIALCQLMADNSSEEGLQRHIEHNVGYLTGLFGTTDNSDLAVLFKPWVGTQYRADFCVLQSFQGGSVAHLIEIESSHERLFTNALTPARRLQQAQGQIRNWREWVSSNAQHYARELIRVACDLPLFGSQVAALDSAM